MLEIKELSARCPERAILNQVNLTVHPGECHILVGPNGSGKSTLGRVILGDPQYEVTGGSIHFQGEDFAEKEPHERAQAGFFLSFQSPPAIEGLSVKNGLWAAHKAQKEDEALGSYRFHKNLRGTFAQVGLPEGFVDRDINVGFSGGERKKLEVAGLLALGARCAFLDEIDSGVDVDTIRSLGRAINDFLADKTHSLLLVTHSEKLLQEIEVTHAHVFRHGTIEKSGGRELLAQVLKQGFQQTSGLQVVADS